MTGCTQDNGEEGSGAVCLLVLAFALLVCTVVLCVMAFKPHGHPLGLAAPARPAPAGQVTVAPAPE